MARVHYHMYDIVLHVMHVYIIYTVAADDYDMMVEVVVC